MNLKLHILKMSNTYYFHATFFFTCVSQNSILISLCVNSRLAIANIEVSIELRFKKRSNSFINYWWVEKYNFGGNSQTQLGKLWKTLTMVKFRRKRILSIFPNNHRIWESFPFRSHTITHKPTFFTDHLFIKPFTKFGKRLYTIY